MQTQLDVLAANNPRGNAKDAPVELCTFRQKRSSPGFDGVGLWCQLLQTGCPNAREQGQCPGPRTARCAKCHLGDIENWPCQHYDREGNWCFNPLKPTEAARDE